MLKRIALVTPEFQEKVGRLVNKLVYRTPAYKGGKKFLSLFGVFDPEDPDDPGYYFIQRLGRDSVAFLLYDNNNEEKPYIVLEQYHSPIRRFVRGAFTGSMDKSDLDAAEITIEEVAEEAGYKVQRDQVHEVDYVPVSANTDEQVHLFIVNVTGLQMDKAEPENLFEQNTRMYRMSAKEVLEGDCEWKAKLIVLWVLNQIGAQRSDS